MNTRIPQRFRNQVEKIAGDRCEYCLLSRRFSFYPHEVDHIVAVSHGGETIFENLAQACFRCNRNKGPNLASTDREGNRAFLFDPRHQRWEDHFRLDFPIVTPLTPVGEATVRALKLNHPDRISERLNDPHLKRS
jgi:hypothetical protein